LSAHPLTHALNPEQARAVTTIHGPLLVLAGAGSGKTRVLTHRIGWMLEQGVRPWNILAVTFTNKAAGEMKERVAHLVGVGARDILVTTFHSACVRFLRRDIEALGYNRAFTILDADDQKKLIKDLSVELKVDVEKWSPASIRGRIDGYKHSLVGPDEVPKAELRTPGDPLLMVWKAYEARLRAQSAVDFNDLINLVVRLWTERPDILARYQERYQYVMVDEYQDTNRAQYELVRLLVGTVTGRSRNLMVVGDDDQSIYAFRGADIRNILDFEKDFPEAGTVRLEQNYRSTGTILKAAHSVVKNNRGRMEKELWTDQGPGEKLGMIVAADDAEEASQLASSMRRLGGEGFRWGDMAVIYRTNATSRAIEQVLVRERIPHVLVGARKFYERQEVTILIAYLRLVINPTDDIAFEKVINVPARGLGPKAIEEMAQIKADQGLSMLEAARRWGAGSGRGRASAARFVDVIDGLRSASLRLKPEELVLRAADDSGYRAALRAENTEVSQSRLENIEELGRAVAGDAEAPDPLREGPVTAIDQLVDFLDRVSLAGQSDELPDSEDGKGAVTLLTAHLAKGLEFPVVFVVGLYEGGFPHFMARDKEEDIEEERRLVYVAFTRAKQRLTVTRARRRMIPGKGYVDVEISRFLREVPSNLIQWSGSGGYTASTAEVDRAQRMARLGLDPDATSRGRPPARPATFAPSSSSSSSAPPRRPQPGLPFRSPLPAPSESESLSLVDEASMGVHRTRVPEGPEDLRVGQRVLHPQFGVGEIRRTDGAPSNLKVTIHFDRAGPKTLFARHAHLEILLP
jgi:DNA helicase-2/ATP-dependent DNA helicase PcrA